MDKKKYDWLQGEIETWIEAKIITAEQAAQIRLRYQELEKPRPPFSEIISWFGAVLMGLGIILLLAYNWDELSRPIRLSIAIGLLVFAQAGTYINFIKQKNGRYLEGWSVFQTLMTGAALALMGQTYHIDLQFDQMLLAWMLLTLPLAYVLPTILPVVIYAMVGFFWNFAVKDVSLLWFGWLMITAMLPLFRYWAQAAMQRRLLFWSMLFYAFGFQWVWIDAFYGQWESRLVWVLFAGLLLLRQKAFPSTGRCIYGWLLAFQTVPLYAMTASNSTFSQAYPQCFAIFMIGITALGRWLEYQETCIARRPFLSFGIACSTLTCFALSFQTLWNVLPLQTLWTSAFTESMLLHFSFIAIALWYGNKRQILALTEWAYMFMAPLVLLLLTLPPFTASIAVNLYLFSLGALLIKQGVNRLHSFWLNNGLAILSLLMLARFFDTNMSYLTRGFVFITLGAAFFVANTWITRRKKEANLNEA